MEHAGYHLLVGLPALIVWVLLIRVWPSKRTEPFAVLARRVVLAGLVVLAASQLVEALGAFGSVSDDDRLSWLANLHGIGVVSSPIGLMTTMAGVVLSVTTVVAARTGHLESRWLRLSIGAAAIVCVAFIGGSFIFGY